MLSKKLSELRKERNLKLREISTIIGVTQSAVSMYESGERRPDYNILLKIANFYGVSTDYLLRDETKVLDEDKAKLLNESYARVMQRAKDSGIPPNDLNMAIDFILRAKRRDEDA